jgi:hypothetical protein
MEADDVEGGPGDGTNWRAAARLAEGMRMSKVAEHRKDDGVTELKFNERTGGRAG